MLIEFDTPAEATYIVSDEAQLKLVQIFFSFVKSFYKNLSIDKQILADTAARSVLYTMEEGLRAKGVAAEECAKLRPGKKEDAAMKLIGLMAANVTEPMKYVEIFIESHTEHDYQIITDFSYDVNLPEKDDT